MTNSKLFFRSLLIIVLLAGFAHLMAFTTKDKSIEARLEPIDQTEKGIADMDRITSMAEEGKNNVLAEKDYLIGNWKVTYNSDEFKGAVIYQIVKEGKSFNAYTLRYEDEKGNAQIAEGSKTLVLKKFDGKIGEGTYYFTYEGEKYDIACQIKRKDENTFVLSYNYQGYSDSEIWKRQ